MKNDYYFGPANSFGMRLASMSMQRKTMVGAILMLALLAFEMFNFDTTQFALRSLLGDVRFMGLQWASILAIAFAPSTLQVSFAFSRHNVVPMSHKRSGISWVPGCLAQR